VSSAVNIRVENASTSFTSEYREGEVITVPIAHGDGRFSADEATVSDLEDTGRVVFRYVSPGGEVDQAFNPNGSVNSIAGIINDAGNVLGMMPHPERALDDRLGSSDGRALFESLLAKVEA
jgi:phosphoribosylformylglycinamidine synthase